MKQRLFYVLCLALLLLFCPPISRNESNDRRDGNWWREQLREQKLTYVIGFLEGMELGNRFSYWGIREKNDPAIGKIAVSYSEYETKYLSNVTKGRLADGLDAFYSDDRNRRILVHAAVWLVLNQIAGKSETEMQPMIESWQNNVRPPIAKKQPPVRFAVQVGALENQADADALSRRLVGLYQKPILTTPIVSGNRTLYRVRILVGTRAEADALALAESRNENVKSWIVRLPPQPTATSTSSTQPNP
jgi:sporulation related protein